MGSASFRYLSQQYTSWRQGPLDQVQQQCEADAAEVGEGRGLCAGGREGRTISGARDARGTATAPCIVPGACAWRSKVDGVPYRQCRQQAVHSPKACCAVVCAPPTHPDACRPTTSLFANPTSAQADAAVAGTVVVRDAASRLVVAHFRAHTSPLAALQFSPCGRQLATASTAGHSINVFHVAPPPPPPSSAAAQEVGLGGGLGAAGGPAGHAVWLYRLYRGVTPAAIRGIAFAPDASWVAVSSGRGTTHLFHTPAAAPSTNITASAQQQQQQQQQQRAGSAAETGVLGCPAKQAAAGRARKPGLLSGGMAGAATSAARNLYAGQLAGERLVCLQLGCRGVVVCSSPFVAGLVRGNKRDLQLPGAPMVRACCLLLLLAGCKLLW